VKILHFQTHPKNKHWWFDLSKYIYIYHIIYNIYISHSIVDIILWLFNIAMDNHIFLNGNSYGKSSN
jgi:hypothetical protein